MQQLQEQNPESKYIVIPYLRVADAEGASAAAEAKIALGGMAKEISPSPPAPSQSSESASGSDIGAIAGNIAKQAGQLVENEVSKVSIGIQPSALLPAILIGGVAAELATV